MCPAAASGLMALVFPDTRVEGGSVFVAVSRPQHGLHGGPHRLWDQHHLHAERTRYVDKGGCPRGSRPGLDIPVAGSADICSVGRLLWSKTGSLSGSAKAPAELLQKLAFSGGHRMPLRIKLCLNDLYTYLSKKRTMIRKRIIS